MSISAKDVKALRDRTGAGMMDCKKALQANDGDFDASVDWLQKKSIIKSEKKADRVAAEGLIHIWANDDATAAVVLEVNCETDFVSRNDDFVGFVHKMADAIGESGISSLDEVNTVSIDGRPIEEALNEKISTIGEKIELRRMMRYENAEGTIGHYIHAGGQIGVLTNVEGKDAGFARDVAMHTAAMKPSYLSPDEVDETLAAQQEDVFRVRLAEEGKPEKIIPRILQGQMAKWRNEHSLLEQPFVKNPDMSVRQHQENLGNVTIKSFFRLEVGEGIEKQESNLAAEVAEQLKG